MKHKLNKFGEREVPPPYVPTLEQIAEETKKIREGWRDLQGVRSPRSDIQEPRSPKTTHKIHISIRDRE